MTIDPITFALGFTSTVLIILAVACYVLESRLTAARRQLEGFELKLAHERSNTLHLARWLRVAKRERGAKIDSLAEHILERCFDAERRDGENARRP